MLIGEYTHALDEKNRLSIPAKFRSEMGKKVIVTRGLDNCVAVFTLNEWKKTAEKFSGSSMLQADNRDFNRFIFGGAVEVEVDSLGRILVPDFLRIWASLKNRVSVIGVENRVEIWSEEAWSSRKHEIERQADALAEKIGQIGSI